MAMALLIAHPSFAKTESSTKLRFAPTGGRISSDFGWRIDPFNQKKRFHAGLDIAANEGSLVYAPESGTVVFSGAYKGYGNVIILKHSKDLYTLYGHNQELLVDKEAVVKMGQPIAKVGSTGRATGPHLHFEVHYKNKYSDPKDYLLHLQKQYLSMGLLKEPTTIESHPETMEAPTAIGGPEGKKTRGFFRKSFRVPFLRELEPSSELKP